MVPTTMKLSHLSVLDTAKEFSCKCASRAGIVAVRHLHSNASADLDEEVYLQPPKSAEVPWRKC
jgi:hypothetical protein